MILLHGLSISPMTNRRGFTSLGRSPVALAHSNIQACTYQRARNEGCLVRSIRDGRIILRKQFGATCLHNPTNRQLQYIVKSSTSDDWADMDIDSLIDPDSPDFDDIKLDDAFYESMGMTKEEAERDQRFRPEDADPEGRDFTLDDVATLDPNLPEYIQKGLAQGQLFGPPVILLAGFRIEELPMVRHIVDAAGGQEVKVVPVKQAMLHAYVEDVVETPEPEWNTPRPEDFAMSGGWGSQRTIVFGGMKVEAQATVIEFLEEGGLPPICATAATHETKRMKLGELLADAVKYQRSRQNPANDPLDLNNRITDELPDINEHMRTTINNRMTDLEKGFGQDMMDINEDEDGSLRVEFKKDAAERHNQGKAQGQQGTADKFDSSSLSEDVVSKEENESIGVSTPEGKLNDLEGAGSDSYTSGKSKTARAANPGPFDEAMVDKEVENKMDHSSQDTKRDDSHQNPQHPSTSTEANEPGMRPEVTPLSTPESHFNGNSEDILNQNLPSSYTDASQCVESNALSDEQASHADIPVTASNHVEPIQDLDDMFLIDSLVENTLGTDPSQPKEPEKTFDMDDLLNLPLGPGSVKAHTSETAKDAISEDTEKISNGVSEEVMNHTNSGGENDLSEAPQVHTDEVEKPENSSPGEHFHISSSSEPSDSDLPDSVREVVEPDEVIADDHEASSSADEDTKGPNRKGFKRTALPSIATDELEEWIKHNTNEIPYDADKHGFLFNQSETTTESRVPHDKTQKRSKTTKSPNVAKRQVRARNQAGLEQQSHEEMRAALKKAVRQGLDPEELKRMVDSIANEEVQSDKSINRKSMSTNGGNITQKDSSLEDSSSSDSSKVHTKLSDLYSASPIPVDVEQLEIIGHGITETSGELDSIPSQPIKNEGTQASSGGEQSVSPTTNGNEEITPTEVHANPSSGRAQTLTRSELEALADRRGLSFGELLEDAKRRGITLKE